MALRYQRIVSTSNRSQVPCIACIILPLTVFALVHSLSDQQLIHSRSVKRCKASNSNSRNLRLGVWVCVNINATWCANIQAKERNKNIQVYIVWYLLEEYWLYCCILHLTILEEYLHWNKGRLSQERKPRIVISPTGNIYIFIESCYACFIVAACICIPLSCELFMQGIVVRYCLF